MDGEIRAGRTLGRELGGERRPVLFEEVVIGPQEIDDDVYRRTIALRLDGPDWITPQAPGLGIEMDWDLLSQAL